MLCAGGIFKPLTNHRNGKRHFRHRIFLDTSKNTANAKLMPNLSVTTEFEILLPNFEKKLKNAKLPNKKVHYQTPLKIPTLTYLAFQNASWQPCDGTRRRALWTSPRLGVRPSRPAIDGGHRPAPAAGPCPAARRRNNARRGVNLLRSATK